MKTKRDWGYTKDYPTATTNQYLKSTCNIGYGTKIQENSGKYKILRIKTTNFPTSLNIIQPKRRIYLAHARDI
ncbi:hypothetical protein CP061683_2554 [Chlamydia psittaci 06-1683]|nr:hypothetical protein CP061683_2554 [Chlamydia psittaci 06-1683]